MHAKSKCHDDQQPGPSSQAGSTRKQLLDPLEGRVERSDDDFSQPGSSNAKQGNQQSFPNNNRNGPRSESKLLEKFLQMLNNQTKLKREYRKLIDGEKQDLYGEVYRKLHQDSGDKRYSDLIKFIEKATSSNTVKAYISRTKILYGFCLNVAVFGGLRGVFKDIHNNDIYKQIDALLVIIGSYKRYKQPYKQYETYEQFFMDKNPGKKLAILDHGLELQTFLLISERIEGLKRQLKSEPLEELQFILIRYKYFLENTEFKLPSQSERQISNIFDNLNKTPIYAFFMYKHKLSLVRYFDKLIDELKVIKCELQKMDIGKSVTPDKEQLEKIAEVIKNRNDYKELYDDYEIIRDIDSLERIKSYVELVKSVDLSEEKELGKLIIERALQVTGEFLKSSGDSPYLSDKTIKKLKSKTVPIKELTELRDGLSHSHTLCKRIMIENEENDVFTEIKNELRKFEKIVIEILDIVKLRQTEWQLNKADKFIMCGNEEVRKAKDELYRFINDREKSLSAKNIGSEFEETRAFIKKINAKQDSRISSFRERLTMLKNVLDSRQLKDELIKRDSNYNKNLKPYDDRNKDMLIQYYASDKKIRAAIEMLLLDLMTVLTDNKLVLKGLVIEDIPLSIGTWDNASLRNYLGHGTTLLRDRLDYDEPAIIISRVLALINNETKITALVGLITNKEIEKVLFNAMKGNNGKADKFNEEWPKNKMLNVAIQQEHVDWINIIFKSPDYKDVLADVLRSRNDVYSLLEKGQYKQVSSQLKDINKDIDINALLHKALEALKDGKNKELNNIIEQLLRKGATLNTRDVLSLQEKGERVYNLIVEKIVKVDNVDNYKTVGPTQDSKWLCLAAKAGSQNIVFHLLSSSASIDPNTPDDEGQSPLHYAAQNGHLSIVKILLQNGVKYNIENTKRKTPLNLSEKKLTDIKKPTQINNHKEIDCLLYCIDQLFQAVQGSTKNEINSLLAEKNRSTLEAILKSRRSNDNKTLISCYY